MNFLQQLLSYPAMFFFLVGIFAGLLKSDLNVPKSISRYFSLYLMMSIGFLGGAHMGNVGVVGLDVFYFLLLGILFSFLQPFLSYYILRRTTGLDSPTLAAVAAQYGSISMVTFITASSFLDSNKIPYGSYMVAVLAMMEAPAILSGLYLAHRDAPETLQATSRNRIRFSKEVFTNGAILILLCSFVIGWLSGEKGFNNMKGFLIDPFHGVLAFFLLDMGLVVAKEIHHLKNCGFRLIAFSIYMPIVNAFLGVLMCKLVNADFGTAFLFVSLTAGASYIAVPAAMRLTLPQAKSSVYLPMALGVTFPFNIIVGLPFYYFICERVFLK